MTETNAKIHVLADETLGGIKREYVEVDRKAEVGEKIVIVESEGFPKGFIGTVDEFDDYFDDGSFNITEQYDGEIFVDAEADVYHVLEPTDIVHIDGPDGTQRCELTDRNADVGEKVIHVNKDCGKSDGEVTEVTDVGASTVDVVEYEVSDGEYVCGISHGYYRVLVPVEAEADEPQPADLIDVVSNLAEEVSKLKRKVSGLLTTIERHEDEIDTLHKDNRTLGEELARLKTQEGSNECWPAAVSFAEFCENYIAYSKAMREERL